MSSIHPNLTAPMVSRSQTITFKTYDVVLYTDAIGVKPRVQNDTHSIELSDLRDIESWDRALSHPFFMESCLHFVSKQDCDLLPADLKAIFRLESIFFNQNGTPRFEIFTKGSYKKTDFAISAFRALLKLKDYTSQRAQAMADYTKGMAYEYGLGCDVSKSKSELAYKKSADMGDVRAQLLLGYKEKDGEKYNEAKVLFERAVRQGSAEALNELADLYYYGFGCAEDHKKAIDLFRQSAQKGYQLAIDNLNHLEVSINPQGSSRSSLFDELSSSHEESFVDIEVLTDMERLSPTREPKTLPFKKRPIIYGLKKQLIERFESNSSDESSTQSSKRQKMCAQDS